MVAALGGYYYRFGQAFLTVPFFTFLKDPAMIYRLSMVLQAMIQVSIVPVVYVICRRHLRVKSEVLAVLLGAAVCFVPPMTLYVYYYRGDFLLGVLPWYVLLAFLETMRADGEGKSGKKILWTILAVSLFCVFLFGAYEGNCCFACAAYSGDTGSGVLEEKVAALAGTVCRGDSIFIY